MLKILYHVVVSLFSRYSSYLLVTKILSTYKVEVIYRASKIKFIYQQFLDSLFELQYELMDYINWWNKFKKHGKLGCQSLIHYRLDWKLKQAI